MNELLDDIPYGVILCNEVGGMLYVNQAASKLLKCEPGSNTENNILSFIDESFTNKITELISNIKDKSGLTANFTYLKLKTDSEKFYKLVAKPSNTNTANVVFMIYDYTPVKIQQDEIMDAYNRVNDNLIRNSLVLKSISHICNNVLYKDRSNLLEIVVKLASAFHLKKAGICFRNGTGHIVYANRRNDCTYESGKIDGEVKKDCPIWKNESNYITSTELIFKVPRKITCYDLDEQNDTEVNILKLKLNSQKVIGFFVFVEDNNFKLSNAELEILESLSQLLAYIVNNKEQVSETTNYIKEKFRALTQNI